MDELSAFADAPDRLIPLEEELFRRADLVLAGGRSLFEAKRGLHPQVHLVERDRGRARRHRLIDKIHE